MHDLRELREPRKQTIIVLEELDFVWCKDELKEVSRMWREGCSVQSIGDVLERDPDEVLLAIIHLAKSGFIKSRPQGLGGHTIVIS